MSHVERGLERLIDVHKDQAKLRALLSIYLREIDKLEALAIQVRTERALAGVGEQLDQLGRLVLMPREGLSDDAYRVELRAEIRALRSHGTMPDLIDVLALALPDGAVYELAEVHPATVVIDITSEVERTPRALPRAVAGGVALFVVWSPEPVETSLLLAWDDDDEPDGTDQGLGWDDDEDAPGGLLASVVAA